MSGIAAAAAAVDAVSVTLSDFPRFHQAMVPPTSIGRTRRDERWHYPRPER